MRLRSSSRPKSGGSSIIRRERSASDIDLAVHINDAAYRAAMNSHPDPKLRTSFQCPTNLESTAYGSFRRAVKTRAMPSPVGILERWPEASAVRNTSVPRTMSFNS